MTSKNIDYLKKLFEQADIGQLIIRHPESSELSFIGSANGPICDFVIKDWSMMEMVARRGDIGLGEAYHMGLWESSNVADFLTYCSLNLKKIKNHGNATLWNRMIFYFYNHFVRINTKYGSKKNILEHYDISNEFYSLWLDSSMTYSSAICKNEHESLEQAQENKYNRIINNIDLVNKNVLEIGCGWGGFASQATKAGADLTGITISDKQYQYAKKRLENRANILLQDYRDINNKYDRIVSIEMFEAVGEKYWATYFNQIKNSLVKGGKALIQTITINDDEFEGYRKNSDYIRHHVFPGGMLPSKSVFCNEVRKAKLETTNIFEFGNDYAWTLEQWQKNFKLNKDKLVDMNYSEAFLRAWEFYLSLSIAGFKSAKTNVMQVEISNL